jgi:hypothetical protein
VIVSTASAAFPLKTKSPPRNIIPAAFQNRVSFSSAKADEFINLGACCCIVSTLDICSWRMPKSVHQHGSMAKLARII